MNRYKDSHIIGFVVVAVLGIVIDHDSYHAFLAIASGMLAYFMTMGLSNIGFISGKIKRILFFAFMTVAFAQTSVIATRGIMAGGP